jgi:hypothetical protein
MSIRRQPELMHWLWVSNLLLKRNQSQTISPKLVLYFRGTILSTTTASPLNDAQPSGFLS